MGRADDHVAADEKELLKRRRVRASLVEWARFQGFEPAKHHRLLIDKLEAVERGEIRRLLVMMPPGSAKSTYGSKLFPAWYPGPQPRQIHCMRLPYRAAR